MRILFVCLGNICRSPTAEGVFRQRLAAAGLQDLVQVDSAGTAAWHVGKAPDARTQKAALSRGYDLTALRARQFTAQDFRDFDLILAMDKSNLQDIRQLQPQVAQAEVDLFLQRYQLALDEVPDPYYGGPESFEQVLDFLEQAADALLLEVRERL